MRNDPSDTTPGPFHRFMLHRVITAVVCIGALLAVSFGPRLNPVVAEATIPNITQHVPLPFNTNEQEARKRPICSPSAIVAQRAKRLPFQKDIERVIPNRTHWDAVAFSPPRSVAEYTIHSPRAPPTQCSHIR